MDGTLHQTSNLIIWIIQNLKKRLYLNNRKNQILNSMEIKCQIYFLGILRNQMLDLKHFKTRDIN